MYYRNAFNFPLKFKYMYEHAYELSNDNDIYITPIIPWFLQNKNIRINPRLSNPCI